LGQLFITANALHCLTDEDVRLAIHRHSNGDWGDLETEDQSANDHALAKGGRLLSAYHSTAGTKFYVITEWDRSLTTILLPEDY
jgi:hypothetical protein